MCITPSLCSEAWISAVFAAGELTPTTFEFSLASSVTKAPVAFCAATVPLTHASVAVTPANTSKAMKPQMNADERR